MRTAAWRSAMIDVSERRNYRYYMKRVELKVARIGNSRGVRLPAATLKRYHIADAVIMEERGDGILLRPRGRIDQKLSWEDTAREMASSSEDWTAWDGVAADGLDAIPWERRRPSRVAEKSREYAKRPKPKRGARKR